MATLTIVDLDNGKRDLQTVSEVANSRAATAQTRLGGQTVTLYEAIRRISEGGAQAILEFQEEAAAILENLGFFVPVPYASGLSVESPNFTVVGPDGVIYAAQPNQVPFTTGAWDSSQWYPIQNGFDKNRLLSFDSWVEAETAAHLLPDGQVVEAPDTTGIIARFLVQSGSLQFDRYIGLDPTVIDSRQFKIVTDGVTDNADAIDAWVAAIRTARQNGPCIVRASGRILTSRPIVFSLAAADGYRCQFDFSSAEFVCNFNRDQFPYFIFFGNPSNLSEYQAPFNFEGRLLLRRGPSCTYAPVGVEAYGMAQSSFAQVDSSSWDNVLLNFHGPQNVTVKDLILYSGGRTWGYRDLSGSLFTWQSNVISRATGSFVFTPDIVGKTLAVSTTATAYRFTVIEWLSDTQVRVDRANPSSDPASLNAQRTVRVGSAAPKTISGSPVVALDGDMPLGAFLIGLPVAIPRAGSSGAIHFAKVIAVDVVARTVTLDRPCQTTLDPTTLPLTETVDMATPAVQVLSDVSTGIYTNGVSQVRFYNTQVETFRGVAFAVDDAELVEFYGAKFHAVQTGFNWLSCSVGAIWGNTLSGRFFGDCDAAYYGKYRFILGRASQTFNFESLKLRIAQFEKILRVGLRTSGNNGIAVNFNTVSTSGMATTATFPDVVDDENTTFPGYLPPISFVRVDSSQNYRYLSKDTYVDSVGNVTIGGGKAFYNATTGILSFAPGTRVSGPAASFEIWDNDDGGFTTLRFTNGAGAARGEIRNATATGVMDFRVQGTTKFSATTRGLHIPAIPGPFATSGEAIAAGLVQGDLYRDASAVIRIVL